MAHKIRRWCRPPPKNESEWISDKDRFSFWAVAGIQAWMAGSQAWMVGPQAWLDGPELGT